MKIEKREDGSIKKDITVPKVEAQNVEPKSPEVAEPIPEPTPEQRWQALVTQMFQVDGKDVFTWIKANGRDEDEKMKLWATYVLTVQRPLIQEEVVLRRDIEFGYALRVNEFLR